MFDKIRSLYREWHIRRMANRLAKIGKWAEKEGIAIRNLGIVLDERRVSAKDAADAITKLDIGQPLRKWRENAAILYREIPDEEE